MTRYVGRSVSPSVRIIFLAFTVVFCVTAPAQLLKTFFITAPTNPHATSVAVYTALFQYDLTFAELTIPANARSQR